MNEMDIMVNLPDLANDVLEHIANFLRPTHLRRFGGVCHNWRLVAKQKRPPPSTQLPWLVLGEDEKTKKQNVFNLSKQRHCTLLTFLNCTVNKRVNGHVLNPLTGGCFKLPPFPPYSDELPAYTDEKVVDSNGRPSTFSFKYMQTRLAYKAILSHDPKEKPDFTAVILFGETFKPAIWRPGDTVWKRLSIGWSLPVIGCHLF